MPIILFFLAAVLINLAWPLMPMPWPDDVAFLTAGRDLLENGIFRAPYFAWANPSYDAANFNIMPLYGVFVYAWTKLFAIKETSFIYLGQQLLWLPLLAELWRFLKNQAVTKKSALLVICTIVTMPVFIYATHVLRPEWAIGVLGAILILRLWQFDENEAEKVKTRSIFFWSVLLAAAAYMHYNAIFLVPAVAILMLGKNDFARRMKSVLLLCICTLLLMTPWLFYVVTHFAEFQTQFLEQTTRMYSHLQARPLWEMFFIFLVKPCTSGIKNGDVYFVLMIIARCVSLAALLFLGVFAALTKNISKRTVKTIAIVIVTVLFCVKHSESWFRFYIDLTIALAVISAWLDVRKAGFVKISAVSLILLAAVNLEIFCKICVSYPSDYFGKADFSNAVSCIAEKIDIKKGLVTNAIPDPSATLLLHKKDLVVHRMFDYLGSEKIWGELVARQKQFLTARFDVENFDGKNEIRFDYDHQLKAMLEKAEKSGELETVICKNGAFDFYLYKIK